jgi:HK97 gp10 family phage protein
MSTVVKFTRGNSTGYKKGLREGILLVGNKIANQAKALAPVDSGLLRNSFSAYMESDEEGIVGTNVEYAPYVEYGTKRQAAQPTLRPAVYVVANPGTGKLVAAELNLEMRKTLKKRRTTTL